MQIMKGSTLKKMYNKFQDCHLLLIVCAFQNHTKKEKYLFFNILLTVIHFSLYLSVLNGHYPHKFWIKHLLLKSHQERELALSENLIRPLRKIHKIYFTNRTRFELSLTPTYASLSWTSVLPHNLIFHKKRWHEWINKNIFKKI